MAAFAKGYSNNRHEENAYDVGRASKVPALDVLNNFCSEVPAGRIERKMISTLFGSALHEASQSWTVKGRGTRFA